MRMTPPRVGRALIAGLLLLPVSSLGAQMPLERRAAPVSGNRAIRTDDTLRLDLARSVSLALERASAVLLSRENLRLSGSALLESYGRFLPDLRAGTGVYTESGNPLLSSTALRPTNASFYGAAWQLSTGVNLFNGLADREHLRAAIADRSSAVATVDHARQQVAFDVTQAFYQVVLDRRLESVTRATLDLSRAREEQLTAQVNAGTRAPPDLYRQQAQTQFDATAVIDAANRVRADEASLLQRLREEPIRAHTIAEPAMDTTALDGVTTQLDGLLAQAFHSRPDLSAARERAAADGHEERAAQSGQLPRVVLGFDWVGSGRVFDRQSIAGVNQLTMDQRQLLGQLASQGYLLGTLGVSWPIFDRFRTRLETDRAAAITYRDRLLIEDLQLQIEAEVRRALDDYAAARDRMTASAAGLLAAEQAFAAVQGRYDAGLATFVDVLSAQSALTQARALREQALTGYALQKAVMRYVAGEAGGGGGAGAQKK